MDPTLLLTIAIIFVTALVASALRYFSRDRCLSSFDGFHVTIQTKDDRFVWGRMHLESTGFELEYDDDHLDRDRLHIETSYVIYKAEYSQIQRIHRYVDNLTPENRKRRQAAVKRAFHPRLPTRMGRWARNFANTARDSLSEVINLVLSRSRIMSGGIVLAPGQTRMQSMTKEVLGYVGTSYDALLERLIGVRVVFEVFEDEVWHEYVGILTEYTAEFLELVDVYDVEELHLQLLPTPVPAAVAREKSDKVTPESPKLEAHDRDRIVRAWFEGDAVRVRNLSGGATLVKTLVVDDVAIAVDLVLSGKEVYLRSFQTRPHRVELVLGLARKFDVVVPRAHALVRHRAERYDPLELIRTMGGLLVDDDEDEPSARPADCQLDGKDPEACLRHWLFLMTYTTGDEADKYLERIKRLCARTSSKDEERVQRGEVRPPA
jgi:hypothetical protein